MGSYEIVGGVALRGRIPIHGAKNSVLPILAAALASGGSCCLENCPQISDVEAALSILRHLGCQVQQQGDRIWIATETARERQIPRQLMERMRGAVIFLGALLTRFGRARLYPPGGCPLGQRPIDLHLSGLEQMGVQWQDIDGVLHCQAEKLHGCTVTLPFPSVGATENLLLAALSVPGRVTLCNVAKEPEIGDLIGFLQSCGAKIRGADSSVLHIQGGSPLQGCSYCIMPDRMEAASYMAAAAATRGSLLLEQLCPEHLEAVSRVLRRSGCHIQTTENSMKISCEGLLSGAGVVATAPYDGFPTDAQAPVMAALTTAQGTTVFEENIFPRRYCHVPALRRMGANILCAGRHAVVQGVSELHGAQMEATDLRAGAALVIGALAARGRSRITNTEHILRGYEGFAENLRICGGQIRAEGQ